MYGKEKEVRENSETQREDDAEAEGLGGKQYRSTKQYR